MLLIVDAQVLQAKVGVELFCKAIEHLLKSIWNMCCPIIGNPSPLSFLEVFRWWFSFPCRHSFINWYLDWSVDCRLMASISVLHIDNKAHLHCSLGTRPGVTPCLRFACLSILSSWTAHNHRSSCLNSSTYNKLFNSLRYLKHLWLWFIDTFYLVMKVKEWHGW